MATLEQIQAHMKKLQAQVEALAAKKVHAVVDQIRKLMPEHGLTTEDIEAKASASRAAKGPKVSAAAGKTRTTTGEKTKAPPKYQHPKTGATWAGRGRAPAWLAGAKDRTSFSIDGASMAADANVSTEKKPLATKVTTTKAASAKKVAVKKAAAEKTVNARTPAKKAPAKKAATSAVKKAPEKKTPRNSVTVTAPVATVEAGAESTT
ncbi:H-NS histone family protein [Paraburkholderia madseniana]|uniref:H-NS histone family protein n=1 Tax=Paraburkholderia madseniana TaxID=2599607 RepID=UPI0038BD349C